MERERERESQVHFTSELGLTSYQQGCGPLERESRFPVQTVLKSKHSQTPHMLSLVLRDRRSV